MLKKFTLIITIMTSLNICASYSIEIEREVQVEAKLFINKEQALKQLIEKRDSINFAKAIDKINRFSELFEKLAQTQKDNLLEFLNLNLKEEKAKLKSYPLNEKIKTAGLFAGAIGCAGLSCILILYNLLNFTPSHLVTINDLFIAYELIVVAPGLAGASAGLFWGGFLKLFKQQVRCNIANLKNMRHNLQVLCAIQEQVTAK